MTTTFLTMMVVLCLGGFGLSVYMGYWTLAVIDALGGAIYWHWLTNGRDY